MQLICENLITSLLCPLYGLIKAKRILGIRQDSTPKEQQPHTQINKPILKKIDFCSLPWHDFSSFPIHFSVLFNPSDRSARKKISSISSRCFLNCAWIIQTVIWLFNVSEKLDPLSDSSGQIIKFKYLKWPFNKNCSWFLLWVLTRFEFVAKRRIYDFIKSLHCLGELTRFKDEFVLKTVLRRRSVSKTAYREIAPHNSTVHLQFSTTQSTLYNNVQRKLILTLTSCSVV